VDLLERISTSRWLIALKVLPFVALFMLAKLVAHELGWEFIEVGPVLTSMIAASVFLLGFLIAGTLSDYKESEKLPGEISASLETIADECELIFKNKQARPARDCLFYVRDLTNSLLDWFHRKERTKDMQAKITGLRDFFLEFEEHTQANFIARLKQEQNQLRRIVIRIDTIRDTEFVKAGYTIAQLATGLLIFAFACTDLQPFSESLFLFGAVSFLLLYILFLIDDLDNPFSHSEKLSGSRVSLRPIRDTRDRLEEDVARLETSVLGDGRSAAG
jgi:hypothetical protein